MMTNRLFAFLLCGLCAASANSQSLHTLRIQSPADLQRYFEYTGKDIPLVSGHRGGPMKDFPENCIETMQNTLVYTPATFEIDPHITKDSMIVLMHDGTLDRTTTGKGKVCDYTLAELKKLYLKDIDGKPTPYRIPTLDEAIAWAKGKTVLILDYKDVPLAMTARKIKQYQAAAWVMLTVHNATEAKFYYDFDNNAMFEAFVKTPTALKEYEAAGIPWSHVMAYVGPKDTATNKIMYDLLHARKVMCMLSTAPTYDKLEKPKDRANAYRDIIRHGADMIEADRAVETAAAIKPLAPAASAKQSFFASRP
ncbi:MAG TPA: glycerophosphodiester phosphodiesterase family protein [Chitinophagaceae bacterium]|nr:glycerophosphodiester phosphodiesterase family protein [Chitinophagaceae bacterium]